MADRQYCKPYQPALRKSLAWVQTGPAFGTPWPRGDGDEGKQAGVEEEEVWCGDVM
jgi:hypothetical protein